MKKTILTLLFIFTIFNMSNVMITNAESTNKSYLKVDDNQIIMMEKFANLEREIYIKNLIQYVEFESEIIIPEYLNTKYVEYIYNTAISLEIPTRTAFRLIYTESRFKDTIVSPVGAYGLMQLMPDTRSSYYNLLCVDTLKNLDINEKDIYIGLNMLVELKTYWKSKGNSVNYSWKLALASYNAGKGKVIYYQGIPPYKETQDFISFIMKAHSNPKFFANYSKKYENTIKVRS